MQDISAAFQQERLYSLAIASRRTMETLRRTGIAATRASNTLQSAIASALWLDANGIFLS